MPDPTGGSRHGLPVRGEALTTASPLFQGRFGRMFRALAPFLPGEPALKSLAATMVETAGGPAGQNPDMPAGYTYLGQFIDHDITFDPASSLQRQNDPDALTDFRTPRYDLDSLYGRGPADDPFMYDHQTGAPRLNGTVFLIGRDVTNGRDLQRNEEGRALIGDPRNDENLIVSQLHSLFQRFHNRVAHRVADTTTLKGQALFEEAQRLVRWHYQWVVVHDFLRRIVGTQLVTSLLPAGSTAPGLRSRLNFFHWENQPFMPIEFSAAAYRFGHSMIRFQYKINDPVGVVPIFSSSTDPLANLNGFRPLPEQWGFDWRNFFETGPGDPQLARLIDTKLAEPLKTLPASVADAPRALAVRNLLRGRAMGLPSGQAVANRMGASPLTDAQLGITGVSAEFAGHAPLWFYVLKEAERGGGRKLGPVGGRIVAEVLLGLLAGDPKSYLREHPNFKPQPPFARQGRFAMPELIKFTLG
ncbi:MAG: peroxidase family protein [Actinomycetota bacterium]